MVDEHGVPDLQYVPMPQDGRVRLDVVEQDPVAAIQVLEAVLPVSLVDLQVASGDRGALDDDVCPTVATDHGRP